MSGLIPVFVDVGYPVALCSLFCLVDGVSVCPSLTRRASAKESRTYQIVLQPHNLAHVAGTHIYPHRLFNTMNPPTVLPIGSACRAPAVLPIPLLSDPSFSDPPHLLSL